MSSFQPSAMVSLNWWASAIQQTSKLFDETHEQMVGRDTMSYRGLSTAYLAGAIIYTYCYSDSANAVWDIAKEVAICAMPIIGNFASKAIGDDAPIKKNLNKGLKWVCYGASLSVAPVKTLCRSIASKTSAYCLSKTNLSPEIKGMFLWATEYMAIKVDTKFIHSEIIDRYLISPDYSAECPNLSQNSVVATSDLPCSEVHNLFAQNVQKVAEVLKTRINMQYYSHKNEIAHGSHHSLYNTTNNDYVVKILEDRPSHRPYQYSNLLDKTSLTRNLACSLTLADLGISPRICKMGFDSNAKKAFVIMEKLYPIERNSNLSFINQMLSKLGQCGLIIGDEKEEHYMKDSSGRIKRIDNDIFSINEHFDKAMHDLGVYHLMY